MCPPFCQFYKKVVLRLSEHRDVIENANNKVCSPQSFLTNSVPAPHHLIFLFFLPFLYIHRGPIGEMVAGYLLH